MAKVQMPEGNPLTRNNSDEARQTLEKAAPITQGKMRNRSLAMKFAKVFFEGSLKEAVDYMINDIAIPQIKNAVLKGIEVIFYGGVNGSSSNRGGGGGSNVPYNSYWVGRDGSTRPNSNASKSGGQKNETIQKAMKKFDPRLIVVEDRGEAQRVLNELKNDCATYGQIGVDRLFELCRLNSDWTSTKYGWYRGDLDNAKVRPCGDGWWFDVPDPYPID